MNNVIILTNPKHVIVFTIKMQDFRCQIVLFRVILQVNKQINLFPEEYKYTRDKTDQGIGSLSTIITSNPALVIGNQCN